MCPFGPCVPNRKLHKSTPDTYRLGSNSPWLSVLPDSDEVLFSSCVDNARRYFLIPKHVLIPLSLLFVGAEYFCCFWHALFYFSFVRNFSRVFFVVNFAIAATVAAPVPIIAAIRSCLLVLIEQRHNYCAVFQLVKAFLLLGHMMLLVICVS